ncbi:hypothetical protein SAMN05216559_3446 [Halomicrobium zhouii]|uniref:Hsp20/alpha crystallin family protein n=1 Tax=Halomicrobium zhouii TaxID=767519 RepID=A0A1I6LYN5_9EURY|nr:hypothetical protein [Halomicrobium zhouii]SFS08515.1 hypothetical protein SAMN05216559_3446 [Halomicrobium zhouii]
MNGNQQLVDDAPVRRFEYDDGTRVLAADLGVAGDASVDVVDETAIVVSGSDQYDLALPAGDAQAFIKNGVLTVEVTSDSEEAH